MTPHVGDMLYNLQNEVGMVTEVEHLSLDQLFVIRVEWYTKNDYYLVIYRVGEDPAKIPNSYAKNFDYVTMRKRWEDAKRKQ